MTGINQKVMTTDQNGLPLPTNLNDWKGVNRKVTAMWPDSTLAFYQQNLRMRVKGELQRRNGMAQGNIAKQATAVLGILPVSAPQGPGTIVIPSNGTVVGFPTTPIMAFTDGAPRPPIIVGGVCNIYGPYSVSGTTSTMSTQDLPASLSCPGTVTVIGQESSSQGQAPPPYGYQFVISAGATVILSTGCLVNSGSSVTIPAGTTQIAWDITGACAGGGTPGNWYLFITSP